MRLGEHLLLLLLLLRRPGPGIVGGGLRLAEGRWRFSTGLLDATAPGRAVNQFPLVGCWRVFLSASGRAAPATGCGFG